MDFQANKLKGRIVAEGITVADLSVKIGINPATFSRKIAANGDFSRRELQNIKNVLSLSDDDFMSIFFSGSLT